MRGEGCGDGSDKAKEELLGGEDKKENGARTREKKLMWHEVCEWRRLWRRELQGDKRYRRDYAKVRKRRRRRRRKTITRMLY